MAHAVHCALAEVPMFHHVARTEGRVLLFHTWSEAGVLWDMLVRGVPGIVALCLMPDHVHLQTSADIRRPFGAALSAYARWRNARHGRTGTLIGRAPAPAPLVSPEKIARSERYIHLNPCRAGLCEDPLDWPYSTHRDAVGLAIPAVRRPDADPDGIHAYVSSDPSVQARGTVLPCRAIGAPGLAEVFDAVGGLTRHTPDGLQRRGPARDLLLRSARALTSASIPEIAELAKVSVRTVERVRPVHDAQARIVERVAGDPRFHALWPGDVRHQVRWARYRGWD